MLMGSGHVVTFTWCETVPRPSCVDHDRSLGRTTASTARIPSSVVRHLLQRRRPMQLPTHSVDAALQPLLSRPLWYRIPAASSLETRPVMGGLETLQRVDDDGSARRGQVALTLAS